MTPRFIVFEGLDGSGKTTMSRRLRDELAACGTPVAWTCEPEGTHVVGRLIRQILVGDATLPAGGHHASTMALLFAAARLEHLDRVIRPALARGQTVICDRYVLSSLVYQTAAHVYDHPDASHLSWAYPYWIREINSHALMPDLVLVLDVDPAVAIARMATRGRTLELYERDGIEARAALYRNARAYLDSNRVVIDARGDADATYALVRAAVQHLEPRETAR